MEFLGFNLNTKHLILCLCLLYLPADRDTKAHVPVQSPVQNESSVHRYDLLIGNTRCNIYVGDCTNSAQQILASLEPCVKTKQETALFLTCQLKPAWFVLFPSYLMLKGLDV